MPFSFPRSFGDRRWFAARRRAVRYGQRVEADQDVVWITTRRITPGSY
jgi:hypothetical protein